MQTSNRWPHIWLAALFVVVLASQTTFTVDLIRDLTADYCATPVSIGYPWPTITAVHYGKETGLSVGDRIVAVDGRPLAGYVAYDAIIRSRHPGDALAIATDRGGQVAEHRVVLAPLVPRSSGFLWFFAAVTWMLLPWLSIALGFWVAAMRPRDLRAWLTLGILLGLSQLDRPAALSALGWPPAVGVPSAVFRELAQPAWSICMMWFGLCFPHPGRMDRRLPWIKWLLTAPLALMALWNGLRTAGLALAAETTNRLLPRLPGPDWFWIVLLFGTTSLFFMGLGEKYGDESLASDDRRRLKLLYWGCTVAMTPMFLLFIVTGVFLHRQPGDADGLWLPLSLMMMLLFPLTMAYVIVVQRALDVRMVVRQGVQYALARRGIVALRVLITGGVAMLAISLAGARDVNRPRSIALLAVGIALVFLVRNQADRLRRWVDRRFFREAYNAEQILGELSEQVRTILDRDALLQTVTRKLSESLHVERIAVMLQAGGAFRPAFATGYAMPPEVAFAGEAATVSELRRSREPVAVEQPASGSDREALHRLDAQLLLPLASKKELLGFISLGPKKSEEPYSPSDSRLLRTVAAQTGLALENSRLSEVIAHEVAQRELLHREIEIAREVQERLFPQNMPVVAALEYAGHCRPARGVGGDYYDFLALSDGRLGLAIGDVSGKGVPAALLMASLQASVRGQSQAGSDVAGLMANVNRLVCDVSPENRYATFFYAQFDPASRRLVYTNGGHNAPILLRGAEVVLLETGGPPVGLFPRSRYQQAEIALEPGDLLILYTDGISEAENPAEEEWGEDALIATARACRDRPPSEMLARIMEAADAFASGAPQHDDMTLVIARVLAKPLE
ncbi:MAG: SpoIIE family protein phosphatase [Acidobacteriia bacterium]|nr:SpoIIE family protein phosphatase [Terriglobia bacterium]